MIIRIVPWALVVKFLFGECHKILLLIRSQHWFRFTGTKPSPETMLTQIYVITRPQWVNVAGACKWMNLEIWLRSSWHSLWCYVCTGRPSTPTTAGCLPSCGLCGVATKELKPKFWACACYVPGHSWQLTADVIWITGISYQVNKTCAVICKNFFKTI